MGDVEVVGRVVPRRDRYGKFIARDASLNINREARVLRHFGTVEPELPTVGEDVRRVLRRIFSR